MTSVRHLAGSRLSKRQKFVVLSAMLSLLLGAIFWFNIGSWGVAVLLVGTYLAAIWGFDLDLKREEWVVLPLYLLLASVAAYSWMALNTTTVPLLVAGMILYGLAVYALFLTLNILNLATIRPLPLARTATTVLGMAGLVASFSLFYLTLVNQPTLVTWAVTVASVTYLISWPLLWTSMPVKYRLKRSLAWSALIALAMAQLSLLVGLWPNSFMSSLFLAGMLFIALGLLHHQEKKLLTRQIQQQYLLLGGGLLIAFYLVTQW